VLEIGLRGRAFARAERISAEPHTRLRYFCSPHHQDSALYPSIAQLERAAGFRREDTADQRLAKLEGVLALGTNDLHEAVQDERIAAVDPRRGRRGGPVPLPVKWRERFAFARSRPRDEARSHRREWRWPEPSEARAD